MRSKQAEPAPAPPPPSAAATGSRPLTHQADPKTKQGAVELEELYRERAARNHAKVVKFTQWRDDDLRKAARYKYLAESLPDVNAEFDKLYEEAQAKHAEEKGGHGEGQ